VIKKVLSFLALIVFSLLSVGCGAARLNLTVELDDAMKQAVGGRQIAVDVVVLNALQHVRLQNYSMTKYWEPNDQVRNDLPNRDILLFDAAHTSYTISDKDAMWDKWYADSSDKSMPRLYILVQPPGVASPDQDGSKDQRRLILPLDKKRWSTTNVHIVISPSGVTSHPSPVIKPTD
jgi:hypothetical protein